MKKKTETDTNTNFLPIFNGWKKQDKTNVNRWLDSPNSAFQKFRQDSDCPLTTNKAVNQETL